MVRERNRAMRKLINNCLMSYLNPHCAISEQYRTIRNNIAFSSNGRKLRSLLVTSPSPREGKTTTVVNLAICMAQRGDKVLVIDANLRNPILQYVFNCQAAPGLTNVLAGQAELSQSIHQTEIGRLDVLPSGPLLYNSTELLSSQAMKNVMDYATSKYAMVMIDCPPVLEVSEAIAMSSLCDGVVLMLLNGKTQQESAEEAKRSLEFAKANIVGVVLNKKTG